MLTSQSRKWRVLLVDDSPTILGILSMGLSNHPELEVVGTAPDAFVARDKIKTLAPDVITLDVEMPGMSGLDFLERIMRLRPMPVIMLSSITQRGSTAAIQALSLGAVDVQVKPTNGFDTAFISDLADRLIMAARSGARTPVASPSVARNDGAVTLNQWNGKVVLIGASTGGVAALETVLRPMPENAPPILIAQHMPETFLASFAERLDQKNRVRVKLAEDGDLLKQGHVYLAPGGDCHTVVQKKGRQFVCRRKDGPKTNGHYPSVDELFLSAEGFAELVIGVILTGLGRDGADGLKLLKSLGAVTIGQDEATSVVYGMPRAAFELGAVDVQTSLQDVAGHICRMAEKSAVSA